MTHCRLCGTESPYEAEYCPGAGCGADLRGQRTGDPECAVQLYADPDRIEAPPGETVTVHLTVRNSGQVPDKFVLELPRTVVERISLQEERSGSLEPGEERLWVLQYAVPHDPETRISGVGGLFEAPQDDAAGGHALPLRLVSMRDRRVAAGATVTLLPPGALLLPAVSPTASTPPLGVPALTDPDDGPRRRPSTPLIAAGAVVVAIVLVVAAVLALGAVDGGKDRAAPLPSGPRTTSGAPSPETSAAPESAPPSDPASPSASASAQRETVPSVVGLGEAEAVAELRAAGFSPQVVKVTDHAPKGKVASTDPKAGTKAAPGAVVKVRVSTGPSASPTADAQATVPQLAGRSYGDAQVLLAQAGLQARQRTEERPGTAPGTVIGTEPGAGSKLKTGSTVTVVVAKAPSGPEMVSVPDVSGMWGDEANDRAARAGLRLADMWGDPVDGDTRVRRQMTPAGTKVEKGTTITVLTSR